LKVAILADIHANQEALDVCLADVARRGCDRIVILGDIIGYGPDPAYCVEAVQRLAGLGAVVIRGNHEDALANPDVELGYVATTALAWTRTMLEQAEVAYLSGLSLSVQAAGVLFVHAEPKAPAQWSYVTEEGQAAESMRAVGDSVVICGHVHKAAVYHIDDKGAAVPFRPRTGMPIRFSQSRRWLAVAPSVGQPRDGVPMASYAEWDSAALSFTTRRIAYDLPRTVAKVRAAGLPDALAHRLYTGR